MLLEQDAVFVDIETTGGNAQRDRITEIAILKMHKGKLQTEWQSLVNPEVPIPFTIQKLTGITNDMVADSPRFVDIQDEVAAQLKGSIFIAHNARFDYGFIKNEFRRLEHEFRAPVLCTVKLSRKLFPDQRRHNLDAIMRRHDLECEDRHRAYGDAKVLYDFIQQLYETQPVDEVNAAIKHLLKRPSLPKNITAEQVDALPTAPGVYSFYDEKGALLYIGKSISIRDRVLSHFASDHSYSKDMKISQHVHTINTIETAGELGALLLEARMIKQELPIYNQRLRRYDSLTTIHWDQDDFNSIPSIITSKYLDVYSMHQYHGLFKTLKKAKSILKDLAKEHFLCEKKLGLEKGKGACFGYHLKRCHGVCIGEEPELQHRMRLVKALQPLRNQAWPYAGRIGIRETSPGRHNTEVHFFDNWCYLGTAKQEHELKQLDLFRQDELMFDLDTYKILLRYFKQHRQPDIVQCQ